MVKSLAQKLALIGLNPVSINADNISKSVNAYYTINGFVSKVDVNIGKYVSPTDVLFELINPDDIHLALSVFQKDVPLLDIGQQVVASTTHNNGRKYPAEIILISRDINSDGAVEVHCHAITSENSQSPLQQNIVLKNAYALLMKMKNTGED